MITTRLIAGALLLSALLIAIAAHGLWGLPGLWWVMLAAGVTIGLVAIIAVVAKGP